ncbi:MAG: DNA repair protein RecO [Alphaproteobacteria bacterium]|nr:DNA repair protein RecO [Alphaproteobacteria bacterium]
MKWEDSGIVLGVKKFGETDATVGVLTASHGLITSLVKGGQSRKKLATLQTGNQVAVRFTARTEGQMGFFDLELKKQVATEILTDIKKSTALACALAVLTDALPESEPHWKLYENTNILLLNPTLENYIIWERELLDELGFKMDLTKCNATGCTENLAYISPKTGHAVCAAAGEIYKDRLFKIPAIWSETPPANPTDEDLNDALKILEFFLRERVYSNHKKDMPFIRRTLV